MKKQKLFEVIIAHPLPETQRRIADILTQEGIFQVKYVTHDGLDCLRETVSLQPDLVILDLVLDKLDGLEVLRRLKEFQLPNTKYLILSTYAGYLQDYAALTGADACMLLPCSDGALAQLARTVVLPPQAAFSTAAIVSQTVEILRDMGVSNRLKAYNYTLDAMPILIRDPDLIRQRRAVRDLYYVVAQHFEIRPASVERTMRTLVTKLFDEGDPERLARYFTPAEVQRRHVVVSVFLATVAHWVREGLMASSAKDAVALG